MRLLFVAILLAVQALSWPMISKAEEGKTEDGKTEDADKSLEGTWIAQSLEASGKPAPREAVERMQFTFKGDKLLIRGNFKNDRVEECAFTVDSSISPKQLNFVPTGAKKPVLGIYEVKGDELKLCMRHGSSSEGRPTEFATRPNSDLILTVFKRQKP